MSLSKERAALFSSLKSIDPPLQEVKTNYHLEPKDESQHGATVTLSDLYIHGISDLDSVRLQTQEIPPKQPVKPNKTWATYRKAIFTRVHFGSAWRTPQGGADQKHIDRFQALGIRANELTNAQRQDHATDIEFDRCLFTNEGDQMPGGHNYVPGKPFTNALGYTAADTCLIQEGIFPLIRFSECMAADLLQPFKITLRGTWNRCDKIQIHGCPGFRLYIDALSVSQFGLIEVLDSPGFQLTDARGLGLAKLVRPQPREVIWAQAVAIQASVQQMQAKIGEMETQVARLLEII